MEGVPAGECLGQNKCLLSHVRGNSRILQTYGAINGIIHFLPLDGALKT